MDLKKFKNFTKSNDKVKKIEYYGVDKYFEYLKVIKIINYYTVEVLIYNRDKLNKWIFKLNDVDILDDKLTLQNKIFLKNKLELFTLNKYMKFNISKFSLNHVEGTIYFEENVKSSINISLINVTINLSVMREKIKMYEKKKASKEESFNNDSFKNVKNKNVTKLTTIFEDQEITEF